MKLNRIKFNQLILKLNGSLNLYPWRFEQKGKCAVSRKAFLPWLGFRTQLILFTFYAAYIDLTLLRKIFRGLDNSKYDMFGLHLLRSMLGTTFCFWAFEFFVRHSEEHANLYNFTQLSPGNQGFSNAFPLEMVSINPQQFAIHRFAPQA